MVTGYQTLSKERATGAFDILDKKALESRIHTNAMSALEGEVPGVSVYNDKIVIRGVSTFSSSVGNDPLIVIDGLPTEQKLTDININDVESITVLKDAAAASIYGVRAANGVISVVTAKHQYSLHGRLDLDGKSLSERLSLCIHFRYYGL